MRSFAFVCILAACSSKGGNQCPADSTGGPVTGAPNTHCGATVNTVQQAECTPPDAGMADAGPAADAGPTTGYGPTMFGAEGDDDDCKYHVVWSASPICESGDVTFTITVTSKADGSPVLGAEPNIEALLNSITPALESGTATELGDGKYTIGPVRFGVPGQWLVRFHLFENCHDSETSPHGHAAFFVNVP
jgi:hypothetical protein